MIAGKRRIYSKEYKLEIIRQIKDGEKRVSEMAFELGIAAGQIYRWIREHDKYREDSFPGQGKLPEQEDELKKLRKQLADSKEELEILKKAIAIFSKKKNQNTVL